LIIADHAECNVDNILDHLSRIIGSDSMGGLSVAAMKKDYERMLAAARTTIRCVLHVAVASLWHTPHMYALCDVSARSVLESVALLLRWGPYL